MESEMWFSLKNLSLSGINFYRCVLQEKRNPNTTIAPFLRTPSGHKIFDTIEVEFDELHNPEILVEILKVLHLTIQQSSIAECQLMSTSMRNLLKNHTASEKEHWIALQLLKQFLASLPPDFPIQDELVNEIMKPCDNVKMQSQLAMCICLLVDKFERISLLGIIWKDIVKKKSPIMLVNYIDILIAKHRIYQSSEFWHLIENFLLEDSHRKTAIFAIRKVLNFLSTTDESIQVEKYFQWPDEKLLTSWMSYLTILENLEEKQSHLILPALRLLDSVNLGENTPWICIVLQQMLRHKNNLVLRWSVNYLFGKFSELILGNDILEDFFNATNNTWLYNEKESSFHLPQFKIDQQNHFMKVFSEISWKSVPMHAWLMQMRQKIVWNDVSCTTIIGAATRIRQLQNRFIRSNCRDFFVSIFRTKIEDMDLNNFINFIDALYSSSDKLSPEMLSLLMLKIEEGSLPKLSFNVFNILRKQELSERNQDIVFKKLEAIAECEHNWFDILVVFAFPNTRRKKLFCFENYDLDLEELINLESLQKCTSTLVGKLSWDDVSRAIVRELTVDWYTTHFCDIKESDFEDLLYTGGTQTLLNITNPKQRRYAMSEAMLSSAIAELRNLTKRMMDTTKLVRNIIESCTNDQPSFFYKCVNEILDIDLTNNRLALDVFQICLPTCNIEEDDGRKLLIRGLLFGEPLAGDARLEYDYASRMKLPHLECESTYKIREVCLKYICDLNSKSLQLLKLDLINLSKTMSIRKARYFENSKHHRLKLRIAQALAVINCEYPEWDDYYLYAILQENNQTNVNYIYEFLVASTISVEELFNQLENLTKLPPSCQSSLFAISYMKSVRQDSQKEIVEKLITFLLPWTMGSIFNTRLYAQMAVYHLIKTFKVDKFHYLQNAIERGLKESPNAIEKLNTDIRFNYPFEIPLKNVDPILYVTVVPEDERLSSSLEYISLFERVKESRRLHLLKKESNKEQESNAVIEDVQRKMNPEINPHDLTRSVEQQENHSDMIVVASLIDKLPNLGGIARTCEVLGIRDLVLDSAKHTQNKEFKNLSMTAEKWINITEVKPNRLREFLNEKQVEGYKVVGAEQTSNSVNFMEFEFPDKCVLLLGHEKEGIPADLIALLDYAVEIPQFGMVRSLNVHVTGALFMYEYCSQRLKRRTN